MLREIVFATVIFTTFGARRQSQDMNAELEAPLVQEHADPEVSEREARRQRRDSRRQRYVEFRSSRPDPEEFPIAEVAAVVKDEGSQNDEQHDPGVCQETEVCSDLVEEEVRKLLQLLLCASKAYDREGLQCWEVIVKLRRLENLYGPQKSPNVNSTGACKAVNDAKAAGKENCMSDDQPEFLRLLMNYEHAIRRSNGVAKACAQQLGGGKRDFSESAAGSTKGKEEVNKCINDKCNSPGSCRDGTKNKKTPECACRKIAHQHLWPECRLLRDQQNEQCTKTTAYKAWKVYPGKTPDPCEPKKEHCR